MMRHRKKDHPYRVPLRFLMVTYLPALAFLAASAMLHELGGVDFGLISRDPAQEFTHLNPEAYHRLQAFPLIGFQSTLSGLIWFSAFGISVLALVLARHTGQLHLPTTRFLAALGVLTLALGTDDIFMIHDELAPRYLKVLEEPFMAAYVLSITAVLVVFRRTILQRDPVLFLLAIGCFGGSVVVDHFQEQLTSWPYRIFFEDGFKFLGIVGWCGYLIRQSWTVIAAPWAVRTERRTTPAPQPAGPELTPARPEPTTVRAEPVPTPSLFTPGR